MNSDNPPGADNQQETASQRDPQRLDVGLRRSSQERLEKVQSDPHGDMGSWAEMTQPTTAESRQSTNLVSNNSA